MVKPRGYNYHMAHQIKDKVVVRFVKSTKIMHDLTTLKHSDSTDEDLEMFNTLQSNMTDNIQPIFGGITTRSISKRATHNDKKEETHSNLAITKSNLKMDTSKSVNSKTHSLDGVGNLVNIKLEPLISARSNNIGGRPTPLDIIKASPTKMSAKIKTESNLEEKISEEGETPGSTTKAKTSGSSIMRPKDQKRMLYMVSHDLSVIEQANKNKYTKIDSCQHHQVYVGGLTPKIDEQDLQDAFSVFGNIKSCRIIKDPPSFKSSGYAFIIFLNKMDAETAINSMNGQWLDGKQIQVEWARIKSTNTPYDNKHKHKTLNYHKVYYQTTPINTTVLCGNLKQNTSLEIIHAAFKPCGKIEVIKFFTEKGCALIKYINKGNACQAIVDLHNSTLNGQIIQCEWFKASGYTNMDHWPYPQQMGYTQMYNQYAQYTGYHPHFGDMWMG